MLVYAMLVTFIFGAFMGSLITVIAALRMEACKTCEKPVMPPKRKVGPNPFLPTILDYDDK